MNDRQPNPSKAFLGVGWAYPLRLTADDSVATAAYEEDIRQAIHIILGTNPGERLMRPDFGAGLRDFVFEPVNTTTMVLLENRVRGALNTWEPRIDLLDVSVRLDAGEPGKLLVDISYEVRSTNSQQNLVYPFYLQEGSVE